MEGGETSAVVDPTFKARRGSGGAIYDQYLNIKNNALSNENGGFPAKKSTEISNSTDEQELEAGEVVSTEENDAACANGPSGLGVSAVSADGKRESEVEPQAQLQPQLSRLGRHAAARGYAAMRVGAPIRMTNNGRDMTSPRLGEPRSPKWRTGTAHVARMMGGPPGPPGPPRGRSRSRDRNGDMNGGGRPRSPPRGPPGNGRFDGPPPRDNGPFNRPPGGPHSPRGGFGGRPGSPPRNGFGGRPGSPPRNGFGGDGARPTKSFRDGPGPGRGSPRGGMMGGRGPGGPRRSRSRSPPRGPPRSPPRNGNGFGPGPDHDRDLQAHGVLHVDLDPEAHRAVVLAAVARAPTSIRCRGRGPPPMGRPPSPMRGGGFGPRFDDRGPPPMNGPGPNGPPNMFPPRGRSRSPNRPPPGEMMRKRTEAGSAASSDDEPRPFNTQSSEPASLTHIYSIMFRPLYLDVVMLPHLNKSPEFLQLERPNVRRVVYELKPESMADASGYREFVDYLIQGRSGHARAGGAAEMDPQGFKVFILPPGQAARQLGYKGDHMIVVLRSR
ncbi:hypothetical protein GQ600_27240 [Phytophthora cactorum]|nr:hypothetical protein GQ600_27240 [Phytophthora cactorum]